MNVKVKIDGWLYKISEATMQDINGVVIKMENRFKEIKKLYEEDIVKLTEAEFNDQEHSRLVNTLHKLFYEEQDIIDQYEEQIERIKTNYDPIKSVNYSIYEFLSPIDIYKNILGIQKRINEDSELSEEDFKRLDGIINSITKDNNQIL